MTNYDASDTARSLLDQIGVAETFDLYRVSGGGNNQVYEVRLADLSYLLKIYFDHPKDPRDRLQAEYAFTRFAWDHGVRAIAQPHAADADRKAALYEFVDGRPLMPGEVNFDSVDQAIQFYTAINAHRDDDEASMLQNASEACFSLDDHLNCVSRRVERLSGIEPDDDIDREAAQFIREELVPAWTRISTSIQRRMADMSPSAREPIPVSERRLSPSDFGFHNAMIAPDGWLRFIDFEYAGWDDPAKLVCDFFNQVALPVPMDHLEFFVAELLKDLDDPAACADRISMLLPAYRIKWCCIVLNEFIPTDRERRTFSDAEMDMTSKKGLQLNKAIRLLESA